MSDNPSKGALKAAEAIADIERGEGGEFKDSWPLTMAQIIDRETGLGELVKELEAIANRYGGMGGQDIKDALARIQGKD